MEHVAGFLLALFVVCGLRVQDIDLQPAVGTVNDLWFRNYTPLFQGLEHLDEHEIFSPINRNKKKIVILGASAADSLGCDRTWHHPDPQREPTANAAFECSITNQINLQLRERHPDWKAFNLARNGAKLTALLYIYARIMELKPEIVIFADTGGYYAWENGGANDLNNEQYDFITRAFQSDPAAMEAWNGFLREMEKHGTEIPRAKEKVPGPYALFEPRTSTSLADFLELGFRFVRQQTVYDPGPPLPIQLVPFSPNHPVSNPVEPVLAKDPDFGYFQGSDAIRALQKSRGGRYLFIVLPRSEFVYPGSRETWDRSFGKYVLSHGGEYSSELVDLELKPVLETYDGAHQSIFGNKRIATGIIHILEEKHLL